jgi:diacylglycerol kinase (ATP)
MQNGILKDAVLHCIRYHSNKLFDTVNMLSYSLPAMKNKKNNSRWAFIINPVAGNGRSAKYISYLNENKHTLHPEIDIFVTKKPGHATIICDELAKKGYRKFVAVGGDGTFNEVIQSLVKHKNCVMGVFPSGSGNDYAPGVGFPDHYEPWELADLFRCREVPVDVGICNGRYFLNNVGFGFDAKVATDFISAPFSLGKINYWYYVLKNLFFYKPAHSVIRSGRKKTSMKSLLVSVGIGRRCGGGFHLTPEALIDDGLFDVCFARNSGIPGRIAALLDVSGKKHVGKKGIDYYTSKKISLHFDRDIPVHIDGEVFSGKRFNVEILPGAIKMLVHPERENYLKKG